MAFVPSIIVITYHRFASCRDCTCNRSTEQYIFISLTLHTAAIRLKSGRQDKSFAPSLLIVTPYHPFHWRLRNRKFSEVFVHSIFRLATPFWQSNIIPHTEIGNIHVLIHNILLYESTGFQLRNVYFWQKYWYIQEKEIYSQGSIRNHQIISTDMYMLIQSPL